MSTKCVWKICFCVCFSLNFATTAVPRNRVLFALDVVHYNDFHDRFEETSVEFPICATNDTNCIGGFPRLFHEIKTLLEEKPDALLLNAGDAFQGTYWFTLLKWNVTQHFINMLPHDAHTLGNHEFDNGVAGLAPYLQALQAPMVVANINTSLEPSMEGLYKPRIVVERKGRKIGIIGVITPDTKYSSKTGKVIFTDPIKAVKEQAKLLTEEGVDIIIVLSHCGLGVDKAIAKSAGENVDIIVGGHSHSLLWNEDIAPSNEQISGPYPVIVESDNKRGHLVLVVTASAFSKYVGNITAFFNTEGELVTFNGGPVFLNRSIPEDPEIKTLMQPYTEELHKLVNEIVGHTHENLVDHPCGSTECKLGNLIADAFLNSTNIHAPSNMPTVAFFNRNMIRGSIPKGVITRGGIINILPFGNKLVTYSIEGKYIWEALDVCLSKSWNQKPFSGPWMPQVAGMKVIANTTIPKVTSVLVKEGDTYQPLKMDQEYQVSTPDFLITTGGPFQVLKDHSRDVKELGTDFEVFEKYVHKISPFDVQLDHRLVVVT